MLNKQLKSYPAEWHLDLFILFEENLFGRENQFLQQQQKIFEQGKKVAAAEFMFLAGCLVLCHDLERTFLYSKDGICHKCSGNLRLIDEDGLIKYRNGDLVSQDGSKKIFWNGRLHDHLPEK